MIFSGIYYYQCVGIIVEIVLLSLKCRIKILLCNFNNSTILQELFSFHYYLCVYFLSKIGNTRCLIHLINVYNWYWLFNCTLSIIKSLFSIYKTRGTRGVRLVFLEQKFDPVSINVTLLLRKSRNVHMTVFEIVFIAMFPTGCNH